MKILVIGSKGFIGSHLVDFFSKTENCYEADILEDNSKANYFKISIESPDFISIFSKEQFDVCINASGAANVGASLINPVNDFNLNSANVQKILDAIRQTQNNCKFILLSSAAVYVYLINYFSFNNYLKIFIQTIVGVLLYFICSKICKIESYIYIRNLIFKKGSRK